MVRRLEFLFFDATCDNRYTLHGICVNCKLQTIMIQYGTSVLIRDSQCLGKSYVKKRSELTGFEDTIPSFFRPPLSVKSHIRQLKRQREEKEEERLVNNLIFMLIPTFLLKM